VSIHDIFTVPFLLGLSRVILIAIKYSSLSKNERQKFFNEKDKDTVTRWMMQTQLITGWLGMRDDIIQAELRGAAARLSLDLDALYFVVEPNRSAKCAKTRLECFQAWENLARSGSVQVSEAEFFIDPQSFTENKNTKDSPSSPQHQSKKSSLIRRLSIKNQDQERKMKWRQDSVKEMLGSRHVRCELIIEVLLKAARAKAPIVSFSQGTIFALILALVPRIVTMCVEKNAASFFGARTGPALIYPHRNTHKGKHDNPDIFVFICIFSGMFLTTLTALVFLIFLSVNVAHYSRMYMLHRWLALLIRPSFLSHPRFPQIPLCHGSHYASHNVITWLQCRSLICFFGKRYERRLDSYLLLVSFISFISIVIPFLRLLQAGGFGGGNDDDQLRDDLNRIRNSSFVWTTIFCFTTTAIMLTCTIVFAAFANQELDNALGSLTQHRLALHGSTVQRWIRDGEKDDDQLDERFPANTRANRQDMLDEYEDTLELAKEELDVLNRIHVLRVLGQPADISNALSIATTATTIVGYVLGALFLLFV